MNNPIFTVRDMNLWYGQTQALKNINIDNETIKKNITHINIMFFSIKNNVAIKPILIVAII